MFEQLGGAEERYQAINDQLMDPNVVSDPKQYAQLMKEYKNLTPIVEKYREYKKAQEDMDEAKMMLEESGLEKDFRELIEEQYETSKKQIETIAEELKILLIPKDPNDDKNVIVEIRGGAGGDEAALFANSLFRMYSMYAESKGWKIEVLNSNPTELGGYKEVSFSINGDGAYSKFKFESGVHRVQRVPETESQGRIHTSTVTVAVLPEAEDVDVRIDEKDIRVDLFRSSGAGGQKVNKTETAIRLTHFPTGIVVTCQDERSQLKNKEKAYRVLRSRLYDYYNSRAASAEAANRRSLVGTGDRSERIRTYNFPQSRITDHRIGLSLHSMESFLAGDLDEMIDALARADTERRLAQSADE